MMQEKLMAVYHYDSYSVSVYGCRTEKTPYKKFDFFIMRDDKGKQLNDDGSMLKIPDRSQVDSFIWLMQIDNFGKLFA